MNRHILATVATACICAGSAFAAGSGIKAQIASERKGNTAAFEAAFAATEAKTWKSPNGGTLPYRLHLPAKPEAGKLYPLVVHMHGAGSWGTNNVDQIKTGGADFISWAKRHGEEYVFIAPQTPRRHEPGLTSRAAVPPPSGLSGMYAALNRSRLKSMAVRCPDPPKSRARP